MFEKEAKKWVKEHTEIEYKASYGEFSQEPSAIKSFKAGAEFGYNKANEWHYVKDGLPSEDGRYLVCNIFSNNYVATNIAEFNSKNGIFGCIDNSTIYAWKEIVLPELKESK